MHLTPTESGEQTARRAVAWRGDPALDLDPALPQPLLERRHQPAAHSPPPHLRVDPQALQEGLGRGQQPSVHATDERPSDSATRLRSPPVRIHRPQARAR